MLANVQQATIKPIIKAAVANDTLVVHTDEYSIYVPAWGHGHKTVCHARGEYARDEDGDRFCEIHINTMEGFWSLLRSWLRPHRASRKTSCPFISASSSSCTMHADASRPCLAPSSPYSSDDPSQHPGTRQEPSKVLGPINGWGTLHRHQRF
jgi:transposase